MQNSLFTEWVLQGEINFGLLLSIYILMILITITMISDSASQLTDAVADMTMESQEVGSFAI